MFIIFGLCFLIVKKAEKGISITCFGSTAFTVFKGAPHFCIIYFKIGLRSIKNNHLLIS